MKQNTDMNAPSPIYSYRQKLVTPYGSICQVRSWVRQVRGRKHVYVYTVDISPGNSCEYDESELSLV